MSWLLDSKAKTKVAEVPENDGSGTSKRKGSLYTEDSCLKRESESREGMARDSCIDLFFEAVRVGIAEDIKTKSMGHRRAATADRPQLAGEAPTAAHPIFSGTLPPVNGSERLLKNIADF